VHPVVGVDVAAQSVTEEERVRVGVILLLNKTKNWQFDMKVCHGFILYVARNPFTFKVWRVVVETDQGRSTVRFVDKCCFRCMQTVAGRHLSSRMGSLVI